MIPIWKKRKKDSHKGENGKLLIIGGSEDYVGCLYLAGIAALRIGADKVTIATLEKVAWALNALSPDLITKKFKGTHFSNKHTDQIIELAKEYDVILIGNGLSMESASFTRSIIRQIEKPKVIDADAIKSTSLKELHNSIITPHSKEMEILLENSNLNIQDKNQLQPLLEDNIIVLKGKTDYIISKQNIKTNNKGNPGMTKSGTGDVLAGLISGLVAQGMDRFDACVLGAKINSEIADALASKKGYSYLASDIVKEIKRFK